MPGQEEDPLGKSWLTSVNYLFLFAFLAFNNTAPIKAAFAINLLDDSVRFVTTVAAEEIATIYRFARRIALSPLGPK